MDDHPQFWDSVLIETARRHPLMMAAWLLTDAALGAMIGLQTQSRRSFALRQRASRHERPGLAGRER